MSAAFVPVHLHRRDIDPCFTQTRRYFYDTARLVLVVYNQCRSFPGKICSQSIDLADSDPSAADRCTDHFQLSPAFSGHLQPNGIRMRIHKADSFKGKRKPCLFCFCEAFRNPLVVHCQPQQSRHNRAVCSMSAPCCQKRAVQPDLCIHDPFSQKLSHRLTDPHRPRRVRAGGSYHHRSNNIQYVHSFSIPQTRFFSQLSAQICAGLQQRL